MAKKKLYTLKTTKKNGVAQVQVTIWVPANRVLGAEVAFEILLDQFNNLLPRPVKED